MLFVLGLVEEVDAGEAVGEEVDDADGDKLLVQVVFHVVAAGM